MKTLELFKHEITKFIQLALPLTTSRLVYILTPFMATYFLAHLGKTDLAAFAISSRVLMVVFVFIFGFYGSLSVLVSHHYGAQNDSGISTSVGQGFILSIILTAPLSFILYFLAYGLLLTKIDHHVVLLSIMYLHVAIFNILPTQLLEIFDRFLIGIGRTRMVLVISLLQVPLEVLVMYVLVNGKFGLPRLGVIGVAWTYVIVGSVATISVAIGLALLKIGRKYLIREYLFTFNKQHFMELVRVGTPIALTRTIELSTLLIMVLMIGYFGKDQLVAYQIVWQYFIVVIIVVFSIAETIALRVGHEVGHQNINALRFSVKCNFILSTGTIILIALAYAFLSPHLIAFDLDIRNPHYAKLIYFAKQYFVLAAIWIVVDHIRIFATGALRGLKDTRYPMFVSAVGFFSIGVLSAVLLGFYTPLHSVGVWIGIIIGILLAGMIIVRRLYRMLKTIDIKKLLI